MEYIIPRQIQPSIPSASRVYTYPRQASTETRLSRVCIFLRQHMREGTGACAKHVPVLEVPGLQVRGLVLGMSL